MCNYWDKRFLDELIFEKCELKSPIGNGLFDIYINKKELIIYKKIRCKIDNITKCQRNFQYNDGGGGGGNSSLREKCKKLHNKEHFKITTK